MPFGAPVDPEVKLTTARSSGPTAAGAPSGQSRNWARAASLAGGSVTDAASRFLQEGKELRRWCAGGFEPDPCPRRRKLQTFDQAGSRI